MVTPPAPHRSNSNDLTSPPRSRRLLLALGLVLAAGCSSNGATATGTGGSSSSSSSSSGAGGSSSSSSSTGGSASECAKLTTHIERVVCVSNAFLATLTSTEQDTVLYDWTDAVAKTRWSNLPGVQRNGLKFGDLDADSRAAALAVANEVLTDNGYADLTGVLAADDYLNTQGGGGSGGPPDGGPPPGGGDGGPPPGGGDGGPPGGGGLAYSSDNYYIAFIGTPSTTGDWMLQIGGHHMAWNVTYLKGVGYPTPNHIGVEPKASFTINGASYAPLADEGKALLAVFSSLDASQLSTAYLSGQSFADVLLGPDEYATGSYDNVVFPSGANRTGVKVSTLTAAQQALVTAAIEQWVRDFDPAISDALMTEYTSAAAYADTLVAWGGDQAQGVDPDVSGTYMRIDGPRVWIEVACQAGVVIQGQTHYHTIFRDKQMDYGKSL
jgi:hypothetical protein